MDARRSQVYTGIYRFSEGKLVILMEQSAISVSELAEELNRFEEPVTLLGDGVAVYRENLRELLHVPFTEAPPHLNRQRAGALGALAMEYYRAGKLQTAREHQPVYLRLSQAERERAERERAEQERAAREQSGAGQT